MKERPILFTGEMVRAILDGRKTQTRRPVKFQWCGTSDALLLQSQFDPAYKSPFGTVGDRLWVKETWGLMAYTDPTDWFRGSVRGMTKDDVSCQHLVEHHANWERENEHAHWRPSIHMPRWASRIDLEITAVRVERLQDMEGMDAASSDALKEGVHRIHHEGGNYYYSAFRNHPHPQNWTDPCLAFKELWQSIYGTWDANPWVWVYEFRRIKP